ncbi:MAG: response regulator, partial [Planctomycetes bacterium]|nr:response regulator [Planctomycetota bacterium]
MAMADQDQRASERALGWCGPGCKDGERKAVVRWAEANGTDRGPFGSPPAAVLSTERATEGALGIPCRILVVDDLEEHCKVLSERLREMGGGAEWVKTGQEALHRISHLHYDVCLLDLKLGSEDGLEVLESIPFYSRDAQVVVISGYASAEATLKALRLGAVDFLDKPIPDARLRGAIASAMAKAQRIPEFHARWQTQAKYCGL